ncbi:MAG: IPTL-CTERM sorting domain-containing protein [Planctomycetes bacterium]|nr:IPTL-CTERM sorting domain-containing protein [Planctomycetota bacterium]
MDDNADSDGDGVPDCDDQCPGVDDAVFAPECEGAIPTTSQWGLIVLTLLLLVGIKMICFGRRV